MADTHPTRQEPPAAMDLPTLLAPPTWTLNAACLDANFTDFDQANDTARVICADCPVRLTCAIDGFERADPHGIYGGLTPADRRALAPLYGYDTPGMPAHGTRARYVHRTDPCRCDRCKNAHTRWARERRAAGAWTRRTADTPTLTLAS